MPPEFDWVVGCTYRGMPERRADVRNLIGANMSFRRAVFEQVGGFTEDMGRIGRRPLGCEETELCIRARQRWPRGRFVYEPSAVVRHHVTPERVSWAYFRSRCYAEGLSKGHVVDLVGADDGLATERGYVLRTLPGAVGRGLGRLGRRDAIAGAAQAGAVVSGVAITAAGYLTATATRRLAHTHRPAPPVPAAAPAPPPVTLISAGRRADPHPATSPGRQRTGTGPLPAAATAIAWEPADER